MSRKQKKLYKAEIRLSEPEHIFLQRFGLVEEMPIKEDYRYAYSEKQALFLFGKIYPPENIIKVTIEVPK